MHFGEKAYRQDEHGGMNEGSVIVNYGARPAIRLDHKKKTSERGGANDLEKTETKVRAFMPWHFKTDMEPTGEKATICGFAVERYRVKQSGFMRRGATMHVWVAPDLQLPKHRYQFEFEFHRTVSPLPVSIPVEKGAVLKVEVVEGDTPVTVTAVSIEPGAPDAALFAKPEGYAGPKLEADRRSRPT